MLIHNVIELARDVQHKGLECPKDALNDVQVVGKVRLVPHFKRNFKIGPLVKLENKSQICNLRFE